MNPNLEILRFLGDSRVIYLTASKSDNAKYDIT